MQTRPASMSIDVLPITQAIPVRTGVEVLDVGPLVITLADGFLFRNGVLVSCHDVQGNISLCAARIEGQDYVTLQLDVAHPHDDFRASASFAISADQLEQMLDRMRATLKIARLEAAGGGEG